MNDHIAIIRSSLRFVHVEPQHDNALDAVVALEAELTRLRDDPNRLDLSTIPEGAGWSVESLPDGGYRALVLLASGNFSDASQATPGAALSLAIERAKQ